jgi:ribonuclease R
VPRLGRGRRRPRPDADPLAPAQAAAAPLPTPGAPAPLPKPGAPAPLPTPAASAPPPKPGAPAPLPKPAASAPLPTRDEIRRFIRESTSKVGKREISRAFNLGPEHRVALRGLLKDLAGEGTLQAAGHRRFTEAGRLPEVMMIQVTGTDPDGDAIARPIGWDASAGPPPIIYMAPERRGQSALPPGARVLARLKPTGKGKYEGRTIKRIAEAPGRILGVYRPAEARGQEGRIIPTDRRAKAEWTVPPGEANGAEAGEIVVAEPLPIAGFGLKPARITERLGKMGDARSVSLICLHTHDIPIELPPEAIAEAQRARAVPLGSRTDLRDTPLITIDGEDARDFDDAVFAEPVEGGYRLIVAIADVADYVRPGTALDRAAALRGNSCYFPDRVVPMLPEALSNGWCSLRPNEDRGCLFVDIRITLEGRKISHSFGRGLMRSAARMTYEQIQHAADTSAPTPLPSALLTHLYGAFRALLAARQARGTLDLDLPERRVVLDETGRVRDIAPRARLDSHRLIEEFMILANVCAAEELERLHRPCMYRIHAPPSDEKLQVLRSFLHGIDINLPPGNQIHPRDLDRVLTQVRDTEQAPLVNEVILRSQSQAAYSPDNIGHFGLALARYAHFTSPIRRYADLLVHRALITGLKLGPGGLSAEEAGRFADLGEQISASERRAALAERDAIDRYLAAFMADKVGASFAARVSGVTRFGIFITVLENGASGLVPASSLPDDYWMHDPVAQTLTGRRSGASFRLAQPVRVRLAEASPVTGGLVFRVIDTPGAQTAATTSPPNQLKSRGRRHNSRRSAPR